MVIPTVVSNAADKVEIDHNLLVMNMVTFNLILAIDEGLLHGRKQTFRMAQCTVLPSVQARGFVRRSKLIVEVHAAYKGERKAYYRALANGHPVLRRYLKGWLRRVDRFPDVRLQDRDCET